MYDTSLKSYGGGVSAIADAEFAEQAIDVRLDGGFTDLQVGGDLFVGTAGYDTFQDFQFAIGEGLRAHPFGEFFCDGGGDQRSSAVNCLDGGEELINGHSFEEIGFCAGLEGAEDVFVSIESGKDDESCDGVVGTNLQDGVNPAKIGKLQIHQRDVGFQGAVELDCLDSVAGLAYDFDVGHDVE
jgi:hypothetical protein